MVKVLVVEDSAVAQELLVHLLNSDPEMEVVGTACDGEQAIDFLKHRMPDVITMDINMPRMNGFEATRRIMETTPIPIVIVSGSWDTEEVARTFRALEAGALAAVPRPRGPGHPEHERTAKELIQTVKLMSEVKVVRRRAYAGESRLTGRETPILAEVAAELPVGVEIIAVGASTGGPQALHAILSHLPKDFSLPVLIVQHIAPGFIQGLADWLVPVSGVAIKVADNGEPLQAGQAYVAPDGFQMGVTRDGRIALSQAPAENGLRPSVSYLFRSVAAAYGRRAVAVLLTGMGADGAKELKALKECGAVTIAQDENTSVVYGMPGEALRLGAAAYVLSPERIAAALAALANKAKKTN